MLNADWALLYFITEVHHKPLLQKCLLFPHTSFFEDFLILFIVCVSVKCIFDGKRSHTKTIFWSKTATLSFKIKLNRSKSKTNLTKVFRCSHNDSSWILWCNLFSAHHESTRLRKLQTNSSDKNVSGGKITHYIYRKYLICCASLSTK